MNRHDRRMFAVMMAIYALALVGVVSIFVHHCSGGKNAIDHDGAARPVGDGWRMRSAGY